MVSKIKNENLAKLRELSNLLIMMENENSGVYQISTDVINEIKNVIENENRRAYQLKNDTAKVKCYENMCSKLKIILNKFKIA